MAKPEIQFTFSELTELFSPGELDLLLKESTKIPDIILTEGLWRVIKLDRSDILDNLYQQGLSFDKPLLMSYIFPTNITSKRVLREKKFYDFLHATISFSSVKCLDFLGGKVNFNQLLGNNSFYPLELAIDHDMCHSSHGRILEVLLAHGANPNFVSSVAPHTSFSHSLALTANHDIKNFFSLAIDNGLEFDNFLLFLTPLKNCVENKFDCALISLIHTDCINSTDSSSVAIHVLNQYSKHEDFIKAYETIHEYLKSSFCIGQRKQYSTITDYLAIRLEEYNLQKLVPSNLDLVSTKKHKI